MTTKEKLGLDYVQTKTVSDYNRLLGKDEKHINFDLSHKDAWVAGFEFAKANPSLNGDEEAK